MFCHLATPFSKGQFSCSSFSFISGKSARLNPLVCVNNNEIHFPFCKTLNFRRKQFNSGNKFAKIVFRSASTKLATFISFANFSSKLNLNFTPHFEKTKGASQKMGKKWVLFPEILGHICKATIASSISFFPRVFHSKKGVKSTAAKDQLFSRSLRGPIQPKGVSKIYCFFSIFL